MMVAGALFILLGTSVSAGVFRPSLPEEIIIGRHSLKEMRIVPSSRSSVIENYIQEGTNVFFKPQFIISAEKMPPQLQPLIAAIEKEDGSLLPALPDVHVAKPAEIINTEEAKPFIPEPPNLTPIPEITVIMKDPIMNMPEIIEIKEPVITEEVPPATVLLPLETPRIPVLIEETPMGVEVPHEHSVPLIMEIEEPKEIQVPVEIPSAPILLLMENPALLDLVEETAPVVEFPHEHLAVEDSLVELEMPNEVEILIPPAIELPPSEIPRVTVLIEEIPIVKAEEENETKVPFEIPPGLVLPPMEMNVPVIVNESPFVTDSIPPGPVLPPIELPKLPMMAEEEILISPAPLLPPMEITRVPLLVEGNPIVKVEEENEIKVPIMIPSGPVLPPMEMLIPVPVGTPITV